MDPISYVIDKPEELLGHSPHPAIVAIPLGAWTVSNVCDGLAMTTGEGAFDDAARISMAIGLIGAAGVAVTGLRDYIESQEGNARPLSSLVPTLRVGMPSPTLRVDRVWPR
jgi:uncharacterized membrane protein